MILQSSQVAAAHSALLIDADNFHDPDQLRAVHSQFAQMAGKGFICHAHGNAKLLYQDTLKPVWQELAARLVPCLPLNKNTADAELIVDALLLHFQQGVKRFGIVSGDADFAPLAMQLRELGCEVSCFARKSIAFESIVSYYDRVVRFDVPPERASLMSTPLSSTILLPKGLAPEMGSVSTPLAVAEAIPVDVDKPQEKVVVVTVKRNVPERKGVDRPPEPVVVAPQASQSMNVISQNDLYQEVEAVRKILAALPHWRPHTIKQLNQLGAPLREAGIKKGKAPLHQFFCKYPTFFTVLPLSGAPKQVRLEKSP